MGCSVTWPDWCEVPCFPLTKRDEGRARACFDKETGIEGQLCGSFCLTGVIEVGPCDHCGLKAWQEAWWQRIP